MVTRIICSTFTLWSTGIVLLSCAVWHLSLKKFQLPTRVKEIESVTMSSVGRLSSSDPNSFANVEQWVTKHIHMNLEIDFERKVVHGIVSLTLECRGSADILLLDTRNLKIERVFDKNSGKDLKYELGKPVHSFGSCLNITIPEKPKSVTVSIQYETDPSCTALQWLNPAQTSGKKHPYLFSQCQAIHCRSLLPCQDTPAVKASYSAEMSAPATLEVLMSAQKKESVPSQKSVGLRVHHFDQPVPVPSYLIALVSGALESRKIGPRSKVWSEKEMVDEAAEEFSETEDFIKAGEDLLGPYVWGVYDLLVLPPSFPYGGMENPCLTFVTPTLLAGDKSLADVVAHEIAHSWTGNLVTNANWEHFWLNEGHTMFVQRKILQKIHSEPERHMSALSGWSALDYQISVFGSDHAYTHLVPDLTGVDPDDAFSSVPYEKGHTLLMYLEQLLGGQDVFNKFLRAYIEKFKSLSITTDQWKSFLFEYFKDQEPTLKKVDWKQWFHSPGMPPVKPSYDSSLLDACKVLAERWISCSDEELDQFKTEDLKALTANQKCEFLVELGNAEPLSQKKIEKLQSLYKFNEVKNAEVRCKWIRLCLKAHWKRITPLAINFVTEQGRMKFTRPIYRDLYEWEDSRPLAIENFKAHKSEMHSTTATMVQKDLHL